MIDFSSKLIQKPIDLMEEFQKALISKGKNIKNTTTDPIKMNTYCTFILQVQTAMYSTVSEWIHKDLISIGRILGKKVLKYYRVEGASYNEDYPYIVIHNDLNEPRQIFVSEFIPIFCQCFQDGFLKATRDKMNEVVHSLCTSWCNRFSNANVLLDFYTQFAQQIIEPDEEEINKVLLGMIEAKRLKGPLVD
jgi:hypothetical protein